MEYLLLLLPSQTSNTQKLITQFKSPVSASRRRAVVLSSHRRFVKTKSPWWLSVAWQPPCYGRSEPVAYSCLSCSLIQKISFLDEDLEIHSFFNLSELWYKVMKNRACHLFLLFFLVDWGLLCSFPWKVKMSRVRMRLPGRERGSHMSLSCFLFLNHRFLFLRGERGQSAWWWKRALQSRKK